MKVTVCLNELEIIKRNQEMLENSLTNSKAELKAVNSRMNHAEKQISHLNDRIMEITQSGQETERQIKKKKWKQYKLLMR